MVLARIQLRPCLPLVVGWSGSLSPPWLTTKTESSVVKAPRAGWMAKKAEIFRGNYQRPDVEDSDTVNHLDWYEATGFVRPYPGEKTVRPASDFNRAAPAKQDDDD
jgi:hypothetical protein